MKAAHDSLFFNEIASKIFALHQPQTSHTANNRPHSRRHSKNRHEPSGRRGTALGGGRTCRVGEVRVDDVITVAEELRLGVVVDEVLAEEGALRLEVRKLTRASTRLQTQHDADR